MKNVPNSNEKSPSSIVYQPIIDSNPNDYSTINTALFRCIQLEKPNYAVITFDLPIWLKAVDLTLSQRIPIIPRLGGFHLLKSYLANYGIILVDSGFHGIINSYMMVNWLPTAFSVVIVMIKLFEHTF